MTDPRSGTGLGETCKKHLLECWIDETYGRRQDIENRYIKKGLMVEESGITLLSRLKKQFFVKNQEVFDNDFIVGTPDIITGDMVRDIKSSWDIYTFYMVLYKPVNKVYEYQVRGYMDLTGRDLSSVDYVLIDTPDSLISSRKRKLMYDLGLMDENAQAYGEACDEIDRISLYGDIPNDKRHIGMQFKASPEIIGKVYQRVKECREFLNALS
jgi:hypothetical protein